MDSGELPPLERVCPQERRCLPHHIHEPYAKLTGVCAVDNEASLESELRLS